MLIDDDASSHIYHKIMINDASADEKSILEFYSVDQAISHLKLCKEENDNRWPDLIIVDLNMPNKSGWTFIQEYKEIQNDASKSRIYIASNSENPKDKSKAEEDVYIRELKSKFLSEEFFKIEFEQIKSLHSSKLDQ